MSMLRHWKVVLCMGAIFGVGAVTGGALTFKVVRTVMVNQSGFNNWAADNLKRLENRLKLRPEQVQKIQPILEETNYHLKETSRSAMRDIITTVLHNNEKVAMQLDPDQRLVFDQMNEQSRKRFMEMQRRKLN